METHNYEIAPCHYIYPLKVEWHQGIKLESWIATSFLLGIAKYVFAIPIGIGICV